MSGMSSSFTSHETVGPPTCPGDHALLTRKHPVMLARSINSYFCICVERLKSFVMDLSYHTSWWLANTMRRDTLAPACSVRATMISIHDLQR